MSHDIEHLQDEGFEFIEVLEFKKAIKVGRRLEKMHHISGFEIQALAHAGLDDVGKAIKILEAGVAKAPTAWRLWVMLGNYRSDLEKHTQAHEAYAKALACETVDASSVHLNRAIDFLRQDLDVEAMDSLELVDEPELAMQADAVRITVLVNQGRYGEAILLGEGDLSAMGAQGEPEVLAAIEATLGRAYWEGQNDRQKALSCAWNALDHEHVANNTGSADTAMWVIREVDHRRSDSAKYFRLQIEGDGYRDNYGSPERGFYITFDVVADSPAEALEYVRPFEPENVRRSLRIEKCKEFEPRPDDPMGVYYFTSHVLLCGVDEFNAEEGQPIPGHNGCPAHVRG